MVPDGQSRRCRFTTALDVMISRIASAIFSFVLLCAAQSTGASDRLEPCEESPVEGYYEKVDQLLDQAVSGTVVARFTTIPSFTPESGIRITRDGDVYHVHHVQLLESVWASSWLPPSPSGRVDFELTQAKLPSNSESVQAPRELVEAILRLVQEEVSRSASSDLMGFDGTSYFFRPESALCGKAWSPLSGTRPSKLVALTGGLGSLVHTSSTESKQRVIDAMQQLIKELSAR